MAYVLQVSFESNWELNKPSYIFKFRGREYKLLRGRGQKTNKELDCILSILDTDDIEKYYEVCRDVMIYLGCLSWEWHAPIIVSQSGGHGASADLTIKKVRRVNVTKRTFPAIIHSMSIQRIPYVHTKDQEDAIGLYREALASNNSFFKFLCLWNILNIPARESSLVIDWINDTIKNKRHRIRLDNHIEELYKKDKDIGKYLDEECRDAVAHIRRNSPTRRHIDPNNFEDYNRIASSSYFLEDLVKLYIVDELKLNETQFLFRLKNRDIPEYMTEELKKRLVSVPHT